MSMVAKREATEDPVAPPATKKLKASFACGESLTVVVGKYILKTFTVHKDLVCASSSFFRAATSEQWSELADKTIRLPDHLPDTFEVYVTWLYYDTTDVLESVQKLRPVRGNETEDTRCQDDVYYMAKAWILGDSLDDFAFKNVIMKGLLRMDIDRTSRMNAVIFKVIFINCRRGSGLYQWLVDTACGVYGPTLVDNGIDFVPVEFWHDMLRNFLAVPRNPSNRSFLPDISQLSKYEEHEVACKNEESEKSKEGAQS